MNPILVSWPDLMALGGPAPGDPPGRDCDCENCPHWTAPTSDVLEADCNRAAQEQNSEWCPCPLVLPESGPLVLRVLWRHLVTKKQATSPLGPMQVPEWKHWWVGSDEEWAISHGWDHRVYGNHGDLIDPCEALAVVVREEAEKIRGGA